MKTSIPDLNDELIRDEFGRFIRWVTPWETREKPEGWKELADRLNAIDKDNKDTPHNLLRKMKWEIVNTYKETNPELFQYGSWWIRHQ